MPTPFSTFDAIRTVAQCLANGRADEARRVLEPLIKVAPGYAAAHVLYARACELSDDLEAASEAWGRAAQLVTGSRLIRRERERVVRRLREQRSAGLPSPGEPGGGGGAGWSVLEEEDSLPRGPSTVVVETIAPPGDEDVRTPVEDVEPPAAKLPPANAGPGEPDQESPPLADGLTGELEELISRLENAPAIKPEPDPDRGSGSGAEAPDAPHLTEAPPGIASETLAGVYAAQGQFEKAAETYERLAAQEPERAEDLKERAAEMRARA